ncbi:hypothetical protein FPV67DRAFT_772761 [Lyophyllum atratum]|nr:hypothetical protein FPV67DRAFT_772761 [Lyophyllum atratum]
MRFTLLKQSSLAKTGPQVGFRIDFLGAAALILATVAYQHIPQSQSTLLWRYGSSAIPMPPPPPPTSATKPAPSRTALFGSFQSDSELPHGHYIPLAIVAGGLLAGAATFAAAVKRSKARKDGQPPSENDDEAEEDEDVNEQSSDEHEDGDSSHGDPGDPDDPPPPPSGSKVEYDPPHAPLPTQHWYNFLLIVILSALTVAFTYTRFFPAYITPFRKILDRASRAFACNSGPHLNSVELTTGLEDISLKLNGSIQNASAQLFNATTEFVLDLVLAPIAYPAVALAWRAFDVCVSHPWRTLASDQSSKVVELASVTVVTQKMVGLPVGLNHCWTLAGGLLASALVGAWVISQRRRCQGRPVIMTPVEPGDETTMEENVALVHLEEDDLQSFKSSAVLPIPDVEHSEPAALDAVTSTFPFLGSGGSRLHDPLEIPLPEDGEADWEEVLTLSPAEGDGEDWHRALRIPLPDDTDDGWVEEVPGRTVVAEASSSTPRISSINFLATPVDIMATSDIRPELKGLESSRWAPALTSNPTTAFEASKSNGSDGSRKLKHQQRRAQQRQNKKNKHLIPLLADLALDTQTEMAPQDGPTVVSWRRGGK